jgi:hypothetical protein
MEAWASRPRILQRQQSMDLIDWFPDHGAWAGGEGRGDGPDQPGDPGGGNGQWPFVSDVVTETLGIDRSRLMRSDRLRSSRRVWRFCPLQKTSSRHEKLRRDLPRFCGPRPAAGRAGDGQYVTGVAATDLGAVRPDDPADCRVPREGRVREALRVHRGPGQGEQRQARPSRTAVTHSNGLPGGSMSCCGNGSVPQVAWAKPLNAQRTVIGREIVQPDTPDLYSGIMETVGWFVVAWRPRSAPRSAGRGMALVAPVRRLDYRRGHGAWWRSWRFATA